ncbi:MAG: hypothetical protein IT201_05875 [Thermoleophilia bacterium]|nr:hypothetical protein [Thermoleophilia bacterium]
MVLLAFGAASIFMGVDGLNTVKTNVRLEKITAGDDMTPALIKAGWAETGIATPVAFPTCSLSEGESIDNGSEARCFAQYMRIHALESSGGLTYSELGRFVAATDPGNPAGTSNPDEALTDDSGKPVANGARNTWVTATALTSALNMAFFAENVAKFGIIVGIALVLAGVGFFVLAEVALRKRVTAAAPAGVPTVATAG